MLEWLPRLLYFHFFFNFIFNISFGFSSVNVDFNVYFDSDLSAKRAIRFMGLRN